MNITSIEVIRGNPGVGVAVLPVSALPGEKVELTYGDTLRVNVTFDYRGSTQEVTLYGAIGLRGIGFDEKLTGTVSYSLAESADWAPRALAVDIPITSDIDPGTDYDLYCKLLEYPEAGYPEVDDAIDITGIPPTYELMQHTIYHFAYIYDGDVEFTTATFKTDPFTPSAWLGEQFASKLEEEVRARGGRPLEVKVYVDTTPLLWTDFRIEVTSTPIDGVTEVAPGRIGVGIALWLAIVLVCLAITAVIVVATLAFKTVMEAFNHKPGLEDVKPAWGKEALILDIQDAEEYWERTPTPPEELEGKSEEELRDLLDQIAEEEVPPVPDMWPLIALGVLGVGGLGAIAVAYAMSKPTGE